MGTFKEDDTRPMASSTSWSRTHGGYIAGCACIEGADMTAAQTEAKWGAARLRLLVMPELGEVRSAALPVELGYLAWGSRGGAAGSPAHGHSVAGPRRGHDGGGEAPRAVSTPRSLNMAAILPRRQVFDRIEGIARQTGAEKWGNHR